MSKKTLLAYAILMASLGLAGCGGSSGSSEPAPVGDGADETDGTDGTDDTDGTDGTDGTDEETTTTFSVEVDDGLNGSTLASVDNTTWVERLGSLFISHANAEPVDQLDPSQFSVTIIGGADDGSDLTLDPSEFTVESIGDGRYQIVVPGDPRFDCYIAADVDGDGNLDLRAPTVDDDIRIDPVSEYVTGLLEANADNFANFSLQEIDAIVDQVRQQVDDNPDLQDQISQAVAGDDPDAVKTLLDDTTTVSEQFETAALPAPDNAANLAGDYQFLLQNLTLERTFFKPSDSEEEFPGGILDLEMAHFPTSLSLDGDAVALALGETETIFEAAVFFGQSETEGLEFDARQSTEEAETLPGAVTSLGFNLAVGGDGPQTEGGETETQAQSVLNFLDVTGSFEGFVSSSQFRFLFEDVETDGVFESTAREFMWAVMAKTRTSFDPATLEGDWGLVSHETQIQPSGLVGNEVEAVSFSIDSAGIFNFPGEEELFLNYEINVNDFSTLVSDGGFELVTGEPESIPMSYAEDGTFSFSDPEPTAFGAQGVVFAGNQLMALGIAAHQDAPDTENAADGANTSMIFAVPKAASPQEALAAKTFQLTGRTFLSSDVDVELSKFGPVSLTFSTDGSTADIKGVSNSFIVETPASGTAEQLSETFALSGFSVTVSPNGMVQLESKDADGVVELNGFVSADGQNLVLALVTQDSVDLDGDTGMLVGRCAANCQ